MPTNGHRPGDPVATILGIVGDISEDDFVLGPLGLNSKQEAVYRYILGGSGGSPAAAATALRMSKTAVREALQSLENDGLVSREANRGFVACPPKLALEALVLRRKLELDAAHVRTQRLVERVAERSGSLVRDPSELFTVVEGKEAVRQQAFQLQSTAEREMMVLEKKDYTRAPTPNEGEFSLLKKGVRCRVVYERRVLEMPGLLDRLTEWARAGEESRVIESLPVRMMLADRRMAWIPLHDQQGVITGAAVVRSQELIGALLAMFESTWDRAVPLSEALTSDPSAGLRADLSDMEKRILFLLLSGLKDEAIARQLQVDTSTVRRHIKKMMARLGATTRFQAGAQASRVGLV
jgi:DNA-binding CsgD family transcriptional regulator/biotin operon repressor